MSEIIIYEPADGGKVTVRLEGESLWMTQEQMAELFSRERSVITKHLRNVFREEQLEESSVCANFARTAGDGKTYQTQPERPSGSRFVYNTLLLPVLIGD